MYSALKHSFPIDTSICAPSASLPSLSKLLLFSSSELQDSLGNLHQLYVRQRPTLPPKLILPTRKHRQLIHDASVPDSGYASAEEDDEDEGVMIADSIDDDELDILRADTFERAFAIQWLTNFISRSDEWVSVDGIEESEADSRADAVETATKFLSELLTDNSPEEEEDCSVTRSFRFPTVGNGGSGAVVQVELNDAPLSEEDHTCVGLQSWASSIVLAERVCADPARFSLSNSTKDDGSPLRILELGAGTGLLSIVAAKLVSGASIFATDYHSSVLLNLSANILANCPSDPSSAHSDECSPPPISVHRLDWEHPDYSFHTDHPFDIIIGADVIYHPDHAQWIKACVEHLLLRPGTPCSKDLSDLPSAGGVFWLMMALRVSGRHEGMFHTVEDVFTDASSLSVACTKEGCSDPAGAGQTTKWQLAILEKTELGKTKGLGRADERGYLLFKIGWVPC